MTTPIKLGGTLHTVSGDVVLHATVPPSTTPADLTVYDGHLTVEDYVVLQGRPVAGAQFGGSVNTRSGATVGSVNPRPTVVSAPVSASHRWLVDAATLVNSNQQWYPQGGSSDNSGIAFPTASPHNDPRGEYGYSYRTRAGTFRQPALGLFGQGYGILTPGGNLTPPAATLGLVCVFRPDRQAYYGVFEADQQGSSKGAPLVVRYAKGHLVVYVAGQRVVVRAVTAQVAQPVCLLLSLDAPTHTGRLTVLDSHRWSHTFSVPAIPFVSFYGVLGALGQGIASGGNSGYFYRSSMDVLEVDYWPYAMSLAQTNQHVHTLGVAYRLHG